MADAGFFERCGLDGTTFRDGPSEPPFAAVSFGASGIAYALYRIGLARADAGVLALAAAWCTRASALSTAENAFLCEASVLHSAPGMHAVAALVAQARGQTADVDPFIAASRVPTEHVDLSLGRAGLLVACAELLEAKLEVAARGDELRDALQERVAAATFATDCGLPYLGLAHGWAGVLFALLRWAQATGASAEPYRAKLDELAALHEPQGKAVRWPESNSTSPPSYMPGWCHGAAGHTLLWALAHELLGGDAYGVLAELAAMTAWGSSTDNGTLCCGHAGIGYACAAAYRVTGSHAWLARARLSARFAAADRSDGFYPDSLYKGGVGVALLSSELDTSTMAMPLVERTRT